MKPSIAIVHDNPEHSALTYIDWDLSTLCNYACSYCPERLHDGLLKGPELDLALRFCERLVSHYRGLGRKTFFKFTGGEPTLYRGLVALLRKVKDLGSGAGLNSNGSRAIAWWDQIVEYLDHVILTYHIEFAGLDHFVSVVNLLMEREVTTHINVTMLPDRFDECAEHAYALLSRCQGTSIALKPLTVDFREKLYPYTNSQKEMMQKAMPPPAKVNAFRGAMRLYYQDGTWQAVQPGELILLEQNHWCSWICNAGLESLAIRADGQVYRAACKQGGALGNLNDTEFSLPKTSVRCAKNTCSCIADIRIGKWLGEEAPMSVAQPKL